MKKNKAREIVFIEDEVRIDIGTDLFLKGVALDKCESEKVELRLTKNKRQLQQRQTQCSNCGY